MNDDSTHIKQKSYTKARGVFELAAYISAGIASLITMWANIRQNFYQKLRREELKFLHDERTQELSKNGQRLENGTISKIEYDIERTRIRESSNIRWNKVVGKMEIDGLWDRFRFLNKFEQAKVFAIGAGIFSISVGAIVAAKERRTLYQKIQHLENSNNLQQGSKIL